MPQPYSDDLRGKLLEAYEAGQGSLRELAQQFRVSWGYSKKIRAQQLRSGHKQRPAAAARSGGPGDPAGAATVALGGGPAAGCDFGGAATTHPAEHRGRTGAFLALGLAAATDYAIKKIAPRGRTRIGREPLAAAHVVGTDPLGRSRLFGVSRRKRRDHRNDPPLWLGAAPGTRLGSGSGRSLAAADGAGGTDHAGCAGQHDH